MMIYICIMSANQNNNNELCLNDTEMNTNVVQEYTNINQQNDITFEHKGREKLQAEYMDECQCNSSEPTVMLENQKPSKKNVSSRGLKNVLISAAIRLWKNFTVLNSASYSSYTSNTSQDSQKNRYNENLSIHNKGPFDSSYNTTRGPFSPGFTDNNKLFKTRYVKKDPSPSIYHSYSDKSAFQDTRMPFSRMYKEKEGPFGSYNGKRRESFDSNSFSSRIC